MSAAVLDHQALGKSRVALQYSESQKFLAFIQALLSVSDELEAVLQTAAIQIDIDLAEGVNLDVLGDIVGVGRIIPVPLLAEFFGFEDGSGPLNMGEEGRPSIGGRFFNDSEQYASLTVLADLEYRLLIRAKIIKNHARGTNEDILAGLVYLFPNSPVVVDDNGGMVIQIGIGQMLTAMEQAMLKTLDILPRPGGVRINHRVMFNAAQYFGFDGQLNAMVFGEEGSAIIGGLIAEEF